MAKAILFHNPRCAKSRQAKAILDERGVDYDVRLYLDETPTASELEKVLDRLGLEPEALLRRGEPVFREKFKGKELTRKQWVRAMVEHPKLIERPILIKGRKAIVGRPPERVLELL